MGGPSAGRGEVACITLALISAVRGRTGSAIRGQHAATWACATRLSRDREGSRAYLDVCGGLVFQVMAEFVKYN